MKSVCEVYFSIGSVLLVCLVYAIRNVILIISNLKQHSNNIINALLHRKGIKKKTISLEQTKEIQYTHLQVMFRWLSSMSSYRIDAAAFIVLGFALYPSIL